MRGIKTYFVRKTGLWMALPFLVVGLMMAVSVVPAYAAPAPAGSAATEAPFFREYEIKAGFIYRFISFVSWPEDQPQDTITIGIFGENPFGDAFKSINGETAGDHVVRVKYFRADTDYEELKSCHILFIADLKDDALKDLFEALSDSPVLTIGDSRGFIDKGGMIGFVRQDRRRIGIEINTAATKQVGLTIRSMLKRIAGRIIESVPNSLINVFHVKFAC